MSGLLGTGGENDIGAQIVQRLGDGQADAPGCAGDNRRLACEVETFHFFLFHSGAMRRISTWAIVRLCTSSGPSASRNVRWWA